GVQDIAKGLASGKITDLASLKAKLDQVKAAVGALETSFEVAGLAIDQIPYIAQIKAVGNLAIKLGKFALHSKKEKALLNNLREATPIGHYFTAKEAGDSVNEAQFKDRVEKFMKWTDNADAIDNDKVDIALTLLDLVSPVAIGSFLRHANAALFEISIGDDDTRDALYQSISEEALTISDNYANISYSTAEASLETFLGALQVSAPLEGREFAESVQNAAGHLPSLSEVQTALAKSLRV
ncbi:MAG: hypothetical protein ACI9BD_000905, partial [Candidatus Marinamargulisbacteria bacterium]